MNDAAEAFRLSDLPDPRTEQFRMRCLSVMNWGTFSGLHRMPISAEGSLLLGPSGAGKSTLLDAISALTVPPRVVRFNAAADESSRRDPDRNAMSYVRGAWADKVDEESTRSIAKQYLRPGGTWSALALEYGNALGRSVTLVRWLWTQSASTTTKLHNHFMVADGVFDLAQVPEFSGDRRKLIKQLAAPAFRHHDDSFASFAEHWCRALGITDSGALALLHQTQSTKNLGDLNAFLRDFMLAEPATFGVADELVAEFADLDEAHRAVVAARLQIEILSPARDNFNERERLSSVVLQIGALLTSLTAFRGATLARLLRQEVITLQTQIDMAQADEQNANALVRDVDAQLTPLRQEYADKGGASLAQLETQRSQLVEERLRVVSKQRDAAAWATSLGWTLGADRESFVAQLQQGRQWLESADTQIDDLEQLRLSHALDEHKKLDEFQRLNTEIRALEATRSSIPDAKQQIRARLCADLGIAASRVPFAGELIDVKPEHENWAGAANRLLGGFAVSMLVHQDDYRKVAQWVDQNHLKDRWTYFAVEPSNRVDHRRMAPGSILNLLIVADHAYKDWIWNHLVRQSDYECVDSASDLLKGERRVTRAGQIRRTGRLHEKDDRHEVHDKRHWVLGDNRGKLARYKEDAADVAKALEAAQQGRAKATEDARTLSARKLAATRFGELRWQDIDVGAVAMRLDQNAEQQREARIENPSLGDLEGRIGQFEESRRVALERAAEARASSKSLTKRLSENAEELLKADLEAAALQPAHGTLLAERLTPSWTPTLKSYADDLVGVERNLNNEKGVLANEINSLEKMILQSFNNFLHKWPEERGALQVDLASAYDFFAKLQRVETDGLPVHEDRFLTLLRKQSTQRLAELHRHLSEARRDIEIRLEDVNVALATVPYNPDTFIRLRVEDLGLEEPREFRRRLAEVFARQSETVTDEVAERQFEALRQLILDLRAEDPAKRRWRDIVLDVRKHVEFIADELESKTERLIENYSGSGGKSGGQRQKLTATCLAAALRFQLGGTDGGPPSYAAVVLDEAFTKTDNEFTATCMRIFTELGFQMIVATPIKSVMTLEEFVGGATFVSISNRHTSTMLHIDYDDQARRLKLPEATRRQVDA